MNLDDPLCLCFRVTRRKLLSYLRVQKPRVASQLSMCGGAGTGCGWCVPFLKKLFEENQSGGELDTLTAEEYQLARQAYLEESGKTPPAE
jgi:NAD(P)H-nitrite reductase large subunit